MLPHLSTALHAFVYTARLGSFAAAARAIGVSPAAVGQAIRRLEDDYGVKLFTRTTRKMALTLEGELLLDRVRQPLAELEQVGHVIQESRGIASGALRIAAPTEFGRKKLVPLVADFNKRHPLVTIELDISDSIRSFIDDQVDVAFRLATELSDTSMVARPLLDMTLVTLAAPSYFEAHGVPQTPDDLEHHQCINYRLTDSRALYAWAFRINDTVRRITPHAHFIANEADAVIAAGLAGLGLFQAPIHFVQQQLRDGSLVPVLVDYRATIHTLYVCYPGRKNLPLRVRSFIDFTLEESHRGRFMLDHDPCLLQQEKTDHSLDSKAGAMPKTPPIS
ncbi:transcriptional regulator [Iodidimonas muriae]|uniref:Transcriptional regulator n=1 Tax=Iodidimonas muriae TaxID=261467 RepID=A0ABQ2LG13_9PROT|nr:LysR family transcriptional regulator [Iodidimonas muriae]GER07144.1 transcriptional regulator [Kordiimonadales bacterium JCM 17843]GGO12854.1 transcriptional regulator [Iodidimonas muriae]